MTQRENDQGHTLLEACVMLALFALAGAISAPRLSALSHQLRVRGAAAALEQMATSLPTLARQFDQTLSMRVFQHQIVLSTRTSPPRRVRVLQLPADLDIRINTSDQKILAHAGGALSPSRITIAGKTMRCSLTVSLWGRLRTSCVENV